jgi:hypothetical protein
MRSRFSREFVMYFFFVLGDGRAVSLSMPFVFFVGPLLQLALDDSGFESTALGHRGFAERSTPISKFLLNQLN